MYQHHAKMPVPCATISGEGVRGVMFHPTMFPIGFGLSSFVEREGDDPSIIIDGEGEAMIELIDGTRTQVTKNIIVRLRMAGAARRPERPRRARLEGARRMREPAPTPRRSGE